MIGSDEHGRDVAQIVMGSIGLGEMLMLQDDLVVTDLPDGRVSIEYDVLRRSTDGPRRGRGVIGDDGRFAVDRYRATIAVTIERVSEPAVTDPRLV